MAFAWVHAAARILNNEEKLGAPEVQRRLQALLDAMARDRKKAGKLAPAIDRFLKVSRSYWPGLFHCYSVAGVPRTNNDLEQFFGSSPTTSAGPRGASGLHRGWSCVARCASSPVQPRACATAPRRSCSHAISHAGWNCASNSMPVATSDDGASTSAEIPRRISAISRSS